ncbi:MAG: hypothetical protein AB7F59_00095 [Bdellovibrionales bacterium]
MNENYLSAQQISEGYSQYENLGDLITNIELAAQAQGQVVCEVKVDGLLLTEEDEKRFRNTSLNGIKNISYKTQEIQNLVKESIVSVLQYLARLTETAIVTSEKLRLGQWDEAYSTLNAVVSGTEWVVDMLSQIRIVDKKAQALDLDWQALDDEFLKTTRSLLEAFEKADYVLVADLLEYDWSNSLEKWLSLVNRLASLHTETHEFINPEQKPTIEADLK